MFARAQRPPTRDTVQGRCRPFATGQSCPHFSLSGLVWVLRQVAQELVVSSLETSTARDSQIAPRQSRRPCFSVPGKLAPRGVASARWGSLFGEARKLAYLCSS